MTDLGEIVQKHLRWIPHVEKFYAVKYNNEPGILQILAYLGAGFDCASKAEIVQVLSLEVDPSCIAYMYTNPC